MGYFFFFLKKTKSFLVIILKHYFMVQFTALFTNIIPIVSTLQWLLFRMDKCNQARNVNAENVMRQTIKQAIRQASKTNSSEGKDHNFFQIINSNSNPE